MDSPQISATAVLLDTERLQFQEPFGMDLLHFYPSRGSLGRKPERATQAKVRAREEKKKKKKEKRSKKKEKKKKRNEKNRKEIENEKKLARSKTRIGRLGKSESLKSEG
ncbi:hypothetical protein HYC85_027972 [Camellia sinensis]|uniref:Uncharacterized protein n=1 Tax=Camellia sinensis TaxID=4442 RepID=A0A7J7FUX7_CAMSI|nr:hypothetical protein HYC85_027972 [Camellia sinensis]